MSFTELKKLHWLLSNGHFSVISERALVDFAYMCINAQKGHYDVLDKLVLNCIALRIHVY